MRPVCSFTGAGTFRLDLVNDGNRLKGFLPSASESVDRQDLKRKSNIETEAGISRRRRIDKHGAVDPGKI